MQIEIFLEIIKDIHFCKEKYRKLFIDKIPITTSSKMRWFFQSVRVSVCMSTPPLCCCLYYGTRTSLPYLKLSEPILFVFALLHNSTYQIFKYFHQQSFNLSLNAKKNITPPSFLKIRGKCIVFKFDKFNLHSISVKLWRESQYTT